MHFWGQLGYTTPRIFREGMSLILGSFVIRILIYIIYHTYSRCKLILFLTVYSNCRLNVSFCLAAGAIPPAVIRPFLINWSIIHVIIWDPSKQKLIWVAPWYELKSLRTCNQLCISDVWCCYNQDKTPKEVNVRGF